jgi:hypothetical protein
LCTEEDNSSNYFHARKTLLITLREERAIQVFPEKYLNLGTTSKWTVRIVHNEEQLAMVAAFHMVLLGQGNRGVSDKLGV